jgi:hypothetical protein
MSAKNIVRACPSLLVGIVCVLVAACGSSDNNKVNPTPRCVLPSDCSGALICVQGYCVQRCVESKDCSNGERCIPAAGGNSCQPPEKSSCVYNTECTQPLVCGVDRQCRSQCQGDVDCPSKQYCTPLSKLCADPSIDKNIDPVTHDFIGAVDAGPGPVHPDAGVDVTVAQPDAAAPLDVSRADVPLTPDGPIVDASAVDRAAAAVDVPATGPETNLSFDAAALPADSVVVTPSPSIRQGQINVTITVTRAAGGLASAALFDMGDLTVRSQAGGTDTSLVLKVSVPHGAPLGKRTLKIAAAGGVITAADVVEVTAITAGPTGADANAGSAAAPFLTLKQSILVADVGDTIHLIDGTYNTKGGETWGYVIPANLTIVGDSTAGTIIDGQGATTNPNGFNASAALTLKNLTVLHFNYGIDIKNPSSTVTLQDVQLGNNANAAIYVEQAATGSTVNLLGKSTLIDQPGQSAVYVYNSPNVTVNITDATLQGGSYVVYYAYNCSGSKLNVAGATIKQLANYNAIYMGISSNTVATTATLSKATIVGNISYTDAKGGTMTIIGSTITQKYGNGIDFAASSLSMTDTSITMSAANSAIYLSGAQAAMSLKGVTITGGGYGIQQTGAGSTAKLRGSSIQGTTYDAYILQAGDLDLGTATESGDNVIAAPSGTSYWCLSITRPQGASGGNPVTCSGTTLNGLAPNPGTIDASAGTVSLQPQRYYLTTGNKLIFY